MTALRKDPDSYLSVDPKWTPKLPGPTKPKLFGVNHLLLFVLGNSWPPPDPRLIAGNR